jgi:hypothetical protein
MYFSLFGHIILCISQFHIFTLIYTRMYFSIPHIYLFQIIYQFSSKVSRLRNCVGLGWWECVSHHSTDIICSHAMLSVQHQRLLPRPHFHAWQRLDNWRLTLLYTYAGSAFVGKGPARTSLRISDWNIHTKATVQYKRPVHFNAMPLLHF